MRDHIKYYTCFKKMIKPVHLGKAEESYRQCLALNANGLTSNVSLDCSVLCLFCGVADQWR